MASLSSFLPIIILGAISLNSKVCNGEVHKRLFVSGDSLFHAGNNKYLNGSMRVVQAYYPYGITYHNQSTGRVSDGLINLPQQLANFKKVASSLDKDVLLRSVFLISIGGNDYFSFNTKNPKATQAERKRYQRMEIYELGGRKFGFQNVGPLGCMPLIKQQSFPQLKGICNTNFKYMQHYTIKPFQKALKKLETRLTGFKYSIFDYYRALLDRINNASKYGFKEGIIACCGTGQFYGQNCGGGFNGTTSYNLCTNPSQYVFFDGGHTTEKVNSQLANLIWSGKRNVTRPYNVKQLFELP
ncbi:GDSL esterase/lipase 3-like [Mangifera indica]|uniref:GDSL esterase/lipase 3-like n=1 Tax=Mangifera indica TaxID=29780 RepID=UPI001CFB39B2|nr:GDSL esterase/lipase 3-like [Mangifera indica]